MNPTVASDQPPLTELSFWGRPPAERDAAFAALRTRKHPAWYLEPGQPPGGHGFHALVRYDDIVEASRRPDVFSSAGPGATPGVPARCADLFRSMINLDAPRHTRLRRVVARAFTPRTVESLRGTILDLTDRLIDRLLADGPGDFVKAIAAPLPLAVICELMGVPAEHRAEVSRLSTLLLAGFDPTYSTGRRAAVDNFERAARELSALAERLALEPTGDLVSALVTTNVDGERLHASEVGAFFLLLVVAGNETTRHALSEGLVLLSDNPGQRDRWAADPGRWTPSAVAEILRLASPVNVMRREVLSDCELAGVHLKAGDRVRLYYRSGNRDADVFADPDTFDVGRNGPRHIAFGGFGPHYCLGAHLASLELAVVFERLLARVPGIRAAAPPQRLLSSFINGIKQLPCTWP